MKQNQKEKVRVQETFHVAAALAVVGGFLDAYTYLLRGGVFANAQTGNIVLLAVHLAQGQVRQVLYCIFPIVAFALGVFVTEYWKHRFSKMEMKTYEHRVLAVEILLLAVVGFIPQSIPNSVVNVTVSFVCSLQVNSFRTVNHLPYASTMCTGNLRSGTEKLFRYIIKKDEKSGNQAAHYFGIIVLFIFGALFGTIFGNLTGVRSVWIVCAILFLVLIYTLVRGEEI